MPSSPLPVMMDLKHLATLIQQQSSSAASSLAVFTSDTGPRILHKTVLTASQQTQQAAWIIAEQTRQSWVVFRPLAEHGLSRSRILAGNAAREIYYLAMLLAHQSLLLLHDLRRCSIYDRRLWAAAATIFVIALGAAVVLALPRGTRVKSHTSSSRSYRRGRSGSTTASVVIRDSSSAGTDSSFTSEGDIGDDDDDDESVTTALEILPPPRNSSPRLGTGQFRVSTARPFTVGGASRRGSNNTSNSEKRSSLIRITSSDPSSSLAFRPVQLDLSGASAHLPLQQQAGSIQKRSSSPSHAAALAALNRRRKRMGMRIQVANGQLEEEHANSALAMSSALDSDTSESGSESARAIQSRSNESDDEQTSRSQADGRSRLPFSVVAIGAASASSSSAPQLPPLAFQQSSRSSQGGGGGGSGNLAPPPSSAPRASSPLGAGRVVGSHLRKKRAAAASVKRKSSIVEAPEPIPERNSSYHQAQGIADFKTLLAGSGKTMENIPVSILRKDAQRFGLKHAHSNGALGNSYDSALAGAMARPGAPRPGISLARQRSGDELDASNPWFMRSPGDGSYEQAAAALAVPSSSTPNLRRHNSQIDPEWEQDRRSSSFVKGVNLQRSSSDPSSTVSGDKVADVVVLPSLRTIKLTEPDWDPYVLVHARARERYEARLENAKNKKRKALNGTAATRKGGDSLLPSLDLLGSASDENLPLQQRDVQSQQRPSPLQQWTSFDSNAEEPGGSWQAYAPLSAVAPRQQGQNGTSGGSARSSAALANGSASPLSATSAKKRTTLSSISTSALKPFSNSALSIMSGGRRASGSGKSQDSPTLSPAPSQTTLSSKRSLSPSPVQISPASPQRGHGTAGQVGAVERDDDDDDDDDDVANDENEESGGGEDDDESEFWFERTTRSTAAAGRDWDWRKRRAREQKERTRRQIEDDAARIQAAGVSVVGAADLEGSGTSGDDGALEEEEEDQEERQSRTS